MRGSRLAREPFVGIRGCQFQLWDKGPPRILSISPNVIGAIQAESCHALKFVLHQSRGGFALGFKNMMSTSEAFHSDWL